MTKNKSFTLIELLVVIVIIGILAGVIVVSTSSAITSSQNTKLVAELSNLSKSLEGYSSYPVGSLCIEDTSNNSYFLSYLGLTTFPIHPNYKTGDTALTTNDCFLYFSDGENYSIRTPAMGNKGYLIQESRNPQTKDIQKSCDPGWIPFGNRCVMQYEAKNVNGIATSQAAEMPWVDITYTDAIKECEKIGAHLITNAEWMAIARDIEQIDSNWTEGAVGSGVIKKGNVGVTAGGYNVGAPEAGVSNDLAKLTLSNGSEIYHFSGNVYEWIDNEISLNFPGQAGWEAYTSQAYPLGSYIDQNAMMFDDFSYPNNPNISFRGGWWNLGPYSGVFMFAILRVPLMFYEPPISSNQGVGFRCVK